MPACAGQNSQGRTGWWWRTARSPSRRAPEARLPPSSRTATMVFGMRAFRFGLFTALLAGLLSAAGFLWAPLVAPEVPQLRLATPSIRSRVLEPPFRIPPVSLQLGLPGHLLPAHVAGAFVVRRPPVPVAPRPTPVVVATPTVAPPAPAVVHRTGAPRVVPTPTPVPTPPPTTPVTPETRPGWGCGDNNHNHDGPANGTQSPCNK